MVTASHTPPLRPITAAVLLVMALFLCASWLTARSYTDLHALVARELELRYLSGQLLYLHQQMAESARLAAETGSPDWEKQYRTIAPQFAELERKAVALAPDSAVLGSPTWIASAGLAATEEQAFALVRRGKKHDAVAMLSGPAYRQREDGYVKGLQAMAAAMMTQAQSRLAVERKGVFAAALLELALLAALAGAWVWIARIVRGYLQAVQTAEQALALNNRELEQRVAARTEQLTRANAQLRNEMAQRSKMEVELRQAQKLEAVGRLAAGVAHEINTPIQFVSDSCHFLRDAGGELLGVLGKERAALAALDAGSITATQALDEIHAARAAVELDFLADNLPQATARALEGLDRVTQIVRSMKELSHPGNRERVAIDLNHVIENTLILARNEYKYVADVQTDFAQLPPVVCLPGELNQVVLNLIVNAAHAIAETHPQDERRGNIRIKTALDGDDVLISVGDDGCGIPEAIRDKIFEPFFTTKEIGKGTGQGLALVHTMIVEHHHGAIDVSSSPGHGTTITMRIPVNVPTGVELPQLASAR
ncbi:MAG: sensor histidine kinase [Stenotrophobium sp.]